MSIKSVFAIPFAKRAKKRVYKWAYQPHKTQEKVFKKLISKAKNTAFGKDHQFIYVEIFQDKIDFGFKYHFDGKYTNEFVAKFKSSEMLNKEKYDHLTSIRELKSVFDKQLCLAEQIIQT